MKNEQIAKAKEQASRVAARLGEMGIAVKHSQALEVVAAVFGAENWHAYAADLKKPQASVEVRQVAAEEPFGHKWVEVKLLAGAGDFRASCVRLATSLDDAVAQAKAQFWTDAIASLYPEGVVAVTKVVADMSSLEAIETWLRDCEIDESELDDEVHTTLQECELDTLNSLTGEDDQEDHIDAVEKAASTINNGGFSSQLAFLFEDYENDVPGFVRYLQGVLDMVDWYSQSYSPVIR